MGIHILYYSYKKWLYSDSSDSKESTCGWRFAVIMFAAVIQKETLKSPKFFTLEESEIEAYRILELG